MTKTQHEVKTTPDTRFSRTAVSAECVCGADLGTHYIKTTGKPYATLGKRFQRHLQAVETMGSLNSPHPMRLVGRVTKTRVTNEMWIGHAFGDLPDRLKWHWGQDGLWHSEDQGHWIKSRPWMIIVKNSNGWKVQNYYYHSEQAAFVAGAAWLSNESAKGYEVTMAPEMELESVPVPALTVERYLASLVEEAREATRPKDLVELQTKLKEARSFLELLEGAQQAVEMKLLGLDPEDDPRYETYEHKPNK